MQTRKTFMIILVVLTILSACKPIFNHQITVEEMEDILQQIAGEEMKGRYPGTPEDSLLTAYLVEKMDLSGLVPMADEGMQAVEIESGYIISDQNSLTSGGMTLEAGSGAMTVFGFSASGSVTGNIAVSQWLPGEELQPAQDISSLAAPQPVILLLPFPSELPKASYDAYSTLRSGALEVADAGYAGIIFVAENELPEITHTKRLPLSIPVVCLDIDSAGKLLDAFAAINSLDVTDAEKERGLVLHTDIEVTLQTEVLPDSFTTYNTVFQVKGSDPDLRDEFVIIGAHHDHLGMGGRGSSSRRPDTVAVHYGADDNASGVAGVIEIGQYTMSASPARSFVFTTFAAEEMGLLGSKTFAAEETVPMENVQAMINLDMIGRLNDARQLQIGGVGTSPVFRSIIDSINASYEFSIAYAEAGFGPSDHSSFYAMDVPVLFVSTGAHTDYHTPSDSIGNINFEGMAEVSSFVADIALALGNHPEKIEFTMAGPKESAGSRGRRGGITFGLMPDMMYDGNEGMPVSFVTEGKPAAIGGMKGGDIITAVDGKHVGNVYDYMDRLAALKEGQSVVVTVKRGEEIIELLLKL